MILFVPFDNVDNGIAFPVGFDKSVDKGCELKVADGREMTTSDDVGDETVSTTVDFFSSESFKYKKIIINFYSNV